MSVYKPEGSPFYQFDFWLRNTRFHGSTKRTSRRDAEAVGRAEREQAARRLDEAAAARTSLKLDDVVGRYWLEVGKHHAGSDNTWRLLAWLVAYFGLTKLLSEITDDDVAQMVARRCGERVRRSKKTKLADCPLISAFTVNDTTEQLKKLFTRARSAWGIKFDSVPNWKAHMLAEPQERVRELVGDESERLDDATRDDYRPFFDFVRASGLRQRECLLRWNEVHWNEGQIIKLGKGGKCVNVPITATIRKILWPLRGHDGTHVFTYIARRTRGGRVKGQRYPLTRSGIKTAWRRLRKRAGVTGFRFHDFRHDLGTKVLRSTGNLKLVQRLLNHADVKTTLRYAHVLDSEIAAALERFNANSQRA
jgi:integrase